MLEKVNPFQNVEAYLMFIFVCIKMSANSRSPGQLTGIHSQKVT